MKKAKDEGKRFPFVNERAYISPKGWGKNKYPHKVEDEEVALKYENGGHEVRNISGLEEGYRFNKAKVTLANPDGRVYTNMVTFSKPSAEVVCVRRDESGMWKVALICQPRTPYYVESGGKVYARFFWENPAGLMENDESFEQAARREAEEETGYEVLALQPLMKKVICRHVSYADESSMLFYAILGQHKGQRLDRNEDIKVSWYPVKEVEDTLEAYLDGKIETFYGFDVPEMTILGLNRFLAKLNRGEIKL